MGKQANKAVLVFISAHFESVRHHKEDRNDRRKLDRTVSKTARARNQRNPNGEQLPNSEIPIQKPRVPQIQIMKKEKKPPQTSS
jgi:hypothetical protein